MVPPAASGAQAPAPPFPSSTTIQPSSLSRLTLSDKLLLSQAVHHIGSSPPDWARVSSVLLSHPLIKTKSRLEQAAKAGITLGRVFGSRECERAWVALMRQYNLVLQPGEKDLSIENESDPNNSPALSRSKEARGLPPKMDRGSQLALAQFLYAERIREIQETIKAKEVAFKVLVDEIEKLNAGDLDDRLLVELEKSGKLREEAAEATAQQNAASMAELAAEITTPTKADDELSADYIRRREEASRDTSASSTPLPSPRKVKGSDAAPKAPSEALAPSTSNAESGADVASAIVDRNEVDESADSAAAEKTQSDTQMAAGETEPSQTEAQEKGSSATVANDLGLSSQAENGGTSVPSKAQPGGAAPSIEVTDESVDDKTNGKRKRLADQDSDDDSEGENVQKRSKASEDPSKGPLSGADDEEDAATKIESQGGQDMEVDEEEQSKKSSDTQVGAKDDSRDSLRKSENEEDDVANVQGAVVEGSMRDGERAEKEKAQANADADAGTTTPTGQDEEEEEGDENDDEDEDGDEDEGDEGEENRETNEVETTSADVKRAVNEDEEAAEEQEDEDEEDDDKLSTEAKEEEDENDDEEESEEVQKRPEPRRSRRSGRNMSIATDEPPTPTTLSAKNSRVEALRSREASGTSLEADEERTEALADGLELDTSRSTNEQGSRTSMSPVSARRNGRGASRPSRRSVRGSSAGGSANAAATAANDESAAGSDAERERAAERAATKDHRKMEKVLMLLLNEVSNHTHGNLFHAPIKESDAPDYYQLIRHPLDLKTIKSRIKEGRITTSTQLRRALMQMFANSLIYNRPGSDIHRMALEMRDAAEEMLDRFEQTQMSASATRR